MTDLFSLALPEREINSISALGLAHLGDAVYELMVRFWLCTGGKITSKGLHAGTVNYVKAPAQAKAAERILPMLTEGEAQVFRRGRNAKVNYVPQNSNHSEYHAATGLEALFGYLYLQGEKQRLCELFAAIVGEENAT